jgi:hypothetical protein
MKERRTISVREEALRDRFKVAKEAKDHGALKDIYEEIFELSCDWLVNQNEIVSWDKSGSDTVDRQQGRDYWLADNRGVVPLAVVLQRRGKEDFSKRHAGVMVVQAKTKQNNLRTAASMAKSIKRLMREYRSGFLVNS